MKLGYYTKMFLAYLAATALDFVSSFHMPEGYHESNPFARHADGSFWPAHALVTCGIDTAEILILTLVLWAAFRVFGEKWGKFASGVPWLYFGFGHLDAAVHNFLIRWPHLFQPMPSDLLKIILGHLG